MSLIEAELIKVLSESKNWCLDALALQTSSEDWCRRPWRSAGITTAAWEVYNWPVIIHCIRIDIEGVETPLDALTNEALCT